MCEDVVGTDAPPETYNWPKPAGRVPAGTFCMPNLRVSATTCNPHRESFFRNMKFDS